MGSVDVGIGHDDDPAVAQFLNIETAFAVFLGRGNADAGADRGDERLNFCVLEDLIEAGLLDIDNFALDRQNGLESAIAPLLGRAAGRVAFDDVEFGEGWIALRAVCELSGKSATGEGALADCLTRFASGFAGPCGHEALLDDAFAYIRVLVEVQHQSLVTDRANDSIHLGRDELHFRLGFETRIGMLHAHNGGEAFEYIVSGDRDVFVLQQGVVFCVLVDRAGERSAEAAAVRAAVRIWNGIRVTKELLVVGVRIVQTNLDDHLVPRAFDHDRLGVNERFVFDQALYKFLHSEWVNDLYRLHAVLALINERE